MDLQERHTPPDPDTKRYAWLPLVFIGAFVVVIGLIVFVMATAEPVTPTMNATQADSYAKLLDHGELTENALIALSRDVDTLDAGRAIFRRQCLSCHGMQGEGGSGPNLTDDTYIHGPDIKTIHRVIRDGVPRTEMTGFQTRLTALELARVAAYVGSLRGAKAEGGKAPEGTIHTPAGGLFNEKRAYGNAARTRQGDAVRIPTHGPK
ncbi:c-type cytochrome [bacterium]|nr:c-type cytochrome [bacterium]